MNFMKFVAMDLREIMASLGIRKVDDLVGRTACLRKRDAQIHSRAASVALDMILNEGAEEESIKRFNPADIYDFKLEKTLDESVLLPWFEKENKSKSKEKHTIDVHVDSTDRTFGTILGSEILRSTHGKSGNKVLAEDTYTVNCSGGGGQSFGAFIPAGLTLRLYGDANDGLGKGLSGGKIVVIPPKGSRFKASENVIAGNVALYGATSGKAYICGIAGERFCVRNSGATAVSEGCGDHGLEYMTGGRAVILGPTGKNFAAGMSGGIAYVLDRDHTLYRRINKDMVTLSDVSEKYDIEELKNILTDYHNETSSELAGAILDDFENEIASFKKIIPVDYQKIIAAIAGFEEQGISHEDAELEAFKKVTGSVI